MNWPCLHIFSEASTYFALFSSFLAWCMPTAVGDLASKKWDTYIYIIGVDLDLMVWFGFYSMMQSSLLFLLQGFNRSAERNICLI
jgi:hypothetical protein